MASIHETDYGESFAAVMNPARLVAIGPGEPDSQQLSSLQDLTIEKAFAGQPLRDANSAACCISAIWLWHDFLDQSHQISQAIETASGSFWHGIMHRREGDFSNAKYWFRKVGSHDLYTTLGAAAETIVAAQPDQQESLQLTDNGQWDPFQFVDLCQQALETDSSKKSLCQQLTRLEWQLLFDYCYHQACG